MSLLEINEKMARRGRIVKRAKGIEVRQRGIGNFARDQIGYRFQFKEQILL